MKNKILILIIIVLAALNLATLATIFYHVKNADKNMPNAEMGANSENFNSRFFKEKLALNNEQMDKFRLFNKPFRQQLRDLTYLLTEKRLSMVEELKKNNADTLKLNHLSEEIGQLHSDIKKSTYRYYLDLKQICTPEQQNKLYDAFKTTFECDQKMCFPGKCRQQ